jgi:Protein of unknown function (DUF4231)
VTIEEAVPVARTTADTYLSGRFQQQLSYYSTKSNRAKRWHVGTQLTVIVLTAAVPVTQLVPVDALILRLAAAILGALALVTQGVRGTLQFHENWLAYRGMEQFLEQERSLFLTRAADYAELTDQEAFRRFVEAVEGALKSEHGMFQAQNKQAVAKSRSKDP